MKYLKTVFIFIGLGLIFSCQKSSIPIKPEILTAQYEIKTHSEFEKGYEVYVELNELAENVEIKQIVLLKRLFKVQHTVDSSTQNSIISEYLPLQSRMIVNFSPPKTDSRPDGIIFDINGKEYFQKVKFKLK